MGTEGKGKCVCARVCAVGGALCVLEWHILRGRRAVVRGAFGGSQAGIKGYGLSHKWNACRMAAWPHGRQDLMGVGGGLLPVSVCV